LDTEIEIIAGINFNVELETLSIDNFSFTIASSKLAYNHTTTITSPTITISADTNNETAAVLIKGNEGQTGEQTGTGSVTDLELSNLKPSNTISIRITSLYNVNSKTYTLPSHHFK